MKKWLLSAGLLGFTAVTLGAFGAHALKEALVTEGSVSTWQTAVFYQVIHSIAMLSIGLNMKIHPAVARKWLSRTCTCWLLGVLFFSGSLYWLALGGPKWLGPVTPLGGILLLVGWIGVIIDAIESHKTTPV
jgi:uncharacterized membrane protein YgdD (TMEM256/DUF423 family)